MYFYTNNWISFHLHIHFFFFCFKSEHHFTAHPFGWYLCDFSVVAGILEELSEGGQDVVWDAGRALQSEVGLRQVGQRLRPLHALLPQTVLLTQTHQRRQSLRERRYYGDELITWLSGPKLMTDTQHSTLNVIEWGNPECGVWILSVECESWVYSIEYPSKVWGLTLNLTITQHSTLKAPDSDPRNGESWMLEGFTFHAQDPPIQIHGV